MKKTVYAILIILLVILTGCKGKKATPVPGSTSTSTALPLTAGLGEISGQVEMMNLGEASFVAAAQGAILQVEGQVRTGEDGRARLDFSNGTIVRVAPNTSFTLVSNEQKEEGMLTRIKMAIGRIWIALNGGGMDVETPSGLASVRGSDVEIWVDPQTLDVYVKCFEGDCGADNLAGDTLNLVTGDGAILYHFTGEGNPPPPGFIKLSWNDFQIWLLNNPEGEDVLPDIVDTLTAIPTSTYTPTSTNTPTDTPLSCFQLVSPPDGGTLPNQGQVTFSWTEQVGAEGYLVSFAIPGGGSASFAVKGEKLTRFIESFTKGGTYSWRVTAMDAGGQVICTAGPSTFNKVSAPPTPTFTPKPPKPGKTRTPTLTPTPSETPTFTPTCTPTFTPTPTDTPIPTDTPTFTPVPTDTPTFTPVPSDTPTATPDPTGSPGGRNAVFTKIDGPTGVLSKCVNDYTVQVYDPDGIPANAVSLVYIIYDASTNQPVSSGAYPLSMVATDTYSITGLVISTVPPYGGASGSIVKYRFFLVDFAGNSEFSKWFKYQDILACGGG